MAKRERKTDDFLILKFHKEGRSQRWIARELGCSKTAILKRLRKLLPISGDQPHNQKVTRVDTNTKVIPNYSKTHRYLRKIGTDEIFIWTKYIAIRPDMEEVLWTGKDFIVVTSRLTANLY